MTQYEGQEHRKQVASPSNPGHRDTDGMSIMTALLDMRSKIMEVVEPRLAEGNQRMDRIEAAQTTHSSDIAEILGIMRLGKSFFRVIGYFGAFIKWASPIGVAIAAVWYAIKHGGEFPK